MSLTPKYNPHPPSLKDLDFDTAVDQTTFKLRWTKQSDTGGTQTWICRLGWVYGYTDSRSWTFGDHGSSYAKGFAPTLELAMDYFDKQIQGLLLKKVETALMRDDDE